MALQVAQQFPTSPARADGAAVALKDLPQSARILVIVMRRLGDVLLTTPLLHTLRQGLPQVTIDVLVFSSSKGILAGNPDIDSILTLPERASTRQLLALIGSIWRRYDLSISTQTGDRPTLLAFLAGRRRIGFHTPDGPGTWWKKRVLTVPLAPAPHNHRVLETLRLSEVLGLPAQPRIVCPSDTKARTDELPRGRYAVVHANPMYRYKRWTDAGWRALARALAERDLEVVTTGGPDPAERNYLDALWNGAAVKRLDGRLDWPQITKLMGDAAVYIGIDTSMSHLAAGAGCPTVAIYGPVDPRLMGPWPVGGLAEPWAAAGRVQHRGNVWVVQNPLPCLPCERLGCDGHLNSRSQCLDELSVQQVLGAVDEALQSGSRRT